jgi:hypothetical protein
VLQGLDEGETVVTSSQFLLDSEASLQEAIQRMVRRQASRADGETPAPEAGDAANHENH